MKSRQISWNLINFSWNQDNFSRNLNKLVESRQISWKLDNRVEILTILVEL